MATAAGRREEGEMDGRALAHALFNASPVTLPENRTMRTALTCMSSAYLSFTWMTLFPLSTAHIM